MHLLPVPGDNITLRAAIVSRLLAIPATLALIGLDRRILDDELIWLKPLEFHLSLAVHAATVLFAARLLPDPWQAHSATKVALTLFGAVVI